MSPAAQPPDGGLPSPYSVKRHGAMITNCESEPIHTPGCIQPHGVMLVLRPVDLTIVQVSENSQDWLGHAPDELLGEAVTGVFDGAGGERLRRFLDTQPLEHNPLYAFTTTIPATGKRVDVTVHCIDEVAIVEMEGASRSALNVAECMSSVKRITARLHASSTVAGFCQVLTDAVFEITGLDRVMVYRFLCDGAGEVFAEAKRADLHSWRGLRHPAVDVPGSVKQIFKQISVRPLPDATVEMVELVPLANPETGRPLDMTYCSLRGASVMYTEYLQNMGVAASMTMPLVCGGELWGLVACHHQTPTQFPYPKRCVAEFLTQLAGMQLRGAEQREHTDYHARIDALHHELLATVAQSGDLTAMLASEPNLKDGIECDAVALHHDDSWLTIGPTPTQAQLTALANWLRKTPEFKESGPVLATTELARRFEPAAVYPKLASGLLAIPVGRELDTVILWFRGEEVQTINWAGNPHEVPTKVGPHGPRLTPRKSYEIWQEQAKGRSPPWKSVEVEAALRLRYLVMELVMSRAEHLVQLNTELARSNAELDAFAYVASHDLKEPLRGIYKSAYYLLDEAKSANLSAEARDRLDSLLQLTVRMDGLLDSLLHFAQLSLLELEYDAVPLDAVVREAIEMLGGRLFDAEAEAEAELRVPRPMPTARCDHVRVREIFSNLISNAIKYNDKPNKWVEVGYVAPGEASDLLRPELVPPEVEGQTIYYVRDNGVGIEAKHHERVFAMFKRLHPPGVFGGGMGAGLTITKKLVEQHHGQIWIDSTPGQGTTFLFTLGRGDLD